MSEQFKYVNKDFEDFMELFTELIPQKTPEWTDLSANDPGITILELIATALDILSYNQDVSVNESFLPLAKQRRSVVNLCKSLGYTLRQSVPSDGEVTLTFQPQATNVDIPDKFMVQTVPVGANEQPVLFEVQGVHTLSAGSASITVPIKQGRTYLNEVIGTSNGEQNQSFTFNHIPVIDGSIQLSVNEGFGFETWDLVPSFFDSQSISKHFTASFDDVGAATVFFGDGAFGKIPEEGSTVRVTYRVGGGTVGNVGPNTITRARAQLPGLISLTNVSSPTGGLNREPLDEARRNAPRLFRTRGNVVSQQDYIDIALLNGLVDKANAVADSFGYNIAHVYVAPHEPIQTPASAIAELQDLFDDIRLITNVVNVHDVTYIDMNVTAEVNLDGDFGRNKTKETVEQAIVKEFGYEAMDFGKSISLAKLSSVIMTVKGVEDVTISTPPAMVSANEGEIIRLSDINLTMTGGFDDGA